MHRVFQVCTPLILHLSKQCCIQKGRLCAVLSQRLYQLLRCAGKSAGPPHTFTQPACGFARSKARGGSSLTQPAEERLASIRCKSGQGVSTSDSQPENNGSNDSAAEEPIKHAHERNTSWTRMVLALPLELATVTSRTDNFYLRKRKRKHWWSTEHFPKVLSSKHFLAYLHLPFWLSFWLHSNCTTCCLAS